MTTFLKRSVRLIAGLAAVVAAIYLPFALQFATLTPWHGYESASTIRATQDTSMNKPTQPKRPAAHHGETAWTYDFTGRKDEPLSSNDWNFETGTTVADYNNEAQAYTKRTSNIRIANGALVIEAKPEAYDGKRYTSARIDTKGIFDFTYGTLEVDAKLPAGTGTWPAAWLLPADNRYNPVDYSISPDNRYGWALNGEIDFLEAIGSIPGQNIPAIHSFNEVQRAPTYTPAYVPDSATAFHRYGVIKTPDSITFTIDGVPFNTRVRSNTNPLEWPYDQPYYLVMNLALGGSWAGAQGIDNTSAPWQLQIRSVSYRPLK